MQEINVYKYKFLIYIALFLLIPVIMAISVLSKSSLEFSNGAALNAGTGVLDEENVDVMAVTGHLFLESGVDLNTFRDRFIEDFVDGRSVGMIAAFSIPESAIPTGWLLCDGASIGRTAYPELFAAIGTTYGSVNNFVFNVPDLEGYFLLQNEGEPLGTTHDAQLAPPTGGTTYQDTINAKNASHTHTFTDTYFYWADDDGIDGGINSDTDNVAILQVFRSEGLRNAGLHSHTTSVVTDDETAPKHVRVVYAIKY